MDPSIEPMEPVIDRLSAEGLRGALAAGMARLDQGERDVLVLVAGSGLAFEEVAQALGISVGTVSSRLFRARRKMRATLEVRSGRA